MCVCLIQKMIITGNCNDTTVDEYKFSLLVMSVFL